MSKRICVVFTSFQLFLLCKGFWTKIHLWASFLSQIDVSTFSHLLTKLYIYTKVEIIIKVSLLSTTFMMLWFSMREPTKWWKTSYFFCDGSSIRLLPTAVTCVCPFSASIPQEQLPGTDLLSFEEVVHWKYKSFFRLASLFWCFLLSESVYFRNLFNLNLKSYWKFNETDFELCAQRGILWCFESLLRQLKLNQITVGWNCYTSLFFYKWNIMAVTLS